MPHFRIYKRAWNDDTEKVAIFPHPLQFPINELKDFLLKLGGERQFIKQIHHFLGYTRMDDCQEQASFALEIAMDQAFGTTGASGYRAGGCPLESSNCKEFRRCLYQR